MNLSDSLQAAYTKKWSFINTFQVLIDIPFHLLLLSNWTDYDNEALQLNIISIDTPQITNNPIEAFVANKWVIHNGRDELYRFSITFRDENQMKLYRSFMKIYSKSRDLYFDDISMTIKIYKDADWKNESNAPLITLNNVIMENISQLQFSNTTENQIAEFSIGFKATSITTH